MLARTGRRHEQFRERPRAAFRSVSLTEAGADLAIAEYSSARDPVAAGALIGGRVRRLDAASRSCPSHLAVGLLRHDDAFEAGAHEDLQDRAPIYATLAVLGARTRAWRFRDAGDFLAFKTIICP